MASPLTQSDLIFPTQSLSISSTLHSLKRSALSTHNRLQSILSDADFVASVSAAYGLPTVANERCGSWYIPPAHKAESVYFKSTDGHTNEWSFSLRRLNFQLITAVGKHSGCVIVDSTRRGKSMPDALSKTIPIWCCVMNRALFPDEGPHDLYTPPQAVSESEHAQIETRINGFVREFLDICQPDITGLRAKLQKPLRPIWVIQSSTLPEEVPCFPDFHPVVLCTASRRVNGAEGSEGGYIQGAADDHEAWSNGLTPALFWANKDTLLQTNEEDLPELISTLVQRERGQDAVPILIKPTTNLYISTTHNLDPASFDVVISCTAEPLSLPNTDPAKQKKYLHLACQTGKLGSRDLRSQIARLPVFLAALPQTTPLGKILVCDPTGKDLSVAVGLALVCAYADDTGTITPRRNAKLRIDKKLIKQRLTWFTTTNPALNPPRSTLQTVNAVLMPDPMAGPPFGMDAQREFSAASLVTAEAAPPQKNTHHADGEGIGADTMPSTLKKLPETLFHTLRNDSKPWTFHRTLTSALPSHPSGTVTGTATFSFPHAAQSSHTASVSALEVHSILTVPTRLVYAEEGEFVTTTNLRFTARRKYVYELKPDLEKEDSEEAKFIAVFFHEEGKDVGDLFVEMGELREKDRVRKEETGGVVWHAKNRDQHLCAADLYTATWEFGRGMVGGESGAEGEKWWMVRYDVKGPKKDYVSETRYTRA